MVIVRSWKQRKDGERTYWDYLKCSQYRRAAHDGCVNHDPIRYEDFRELVIGRLLEEGQSISLNFTSDFEKRRQEDLAVLRKQLQQLQNKKKGLLDLFLERLIDKGEFEAKRIELDEAIRQCEDNIFLLENQAHTDTEIRSIIEAFRALKNQDQDLFLAFQALINEIIVHQDGTIDIDFTFRSRQEV